jgi:acetoin utilization deacetylase AcuC-like enzyme
MRITDEGIDELHKTLINNLRKYKILWVLEGGYNLNVLKYSSLNLITNIINL